MLGRLCDRGSGAGGLVWKWLAGAYNGTDRLGQKEGMRLHLGIQVSICPSGPVGARGMPGPHRALLLFTVLYSFWF